MANDIAVNLIAKTEAFQRGFARAGFMVRELSGDMNKSIKHHQRMAATAEKTSKSIKKAATSTRESAKSMSKATQAATQMTFAIDDAASVYGTSGLAGSVRAAANNLTMVAAIMGGLQAQIAATVILVGIQLWQALDKTEKKAEKSTDAMDRLRKSLSDIQETIKAQASFRQSFRGMTALEDVREGHRQITDELQTNQRLQDALNQKLRETKGELDLINQKVAAEQKQRELNVLYTGRANQRDKERIAAAERMKAVQEELNDLARERVELSRQEEAIGKRLSNLEHFKFKPTESQRIDLERLGMAQAREQRQRDEMNRASAVFKELRDAVESEMHPIAAERRRIEQERQKRLKDLDKLRKAFSPEAIEQMRTQINAAAMMKRFDLSFKSAAGDGPDNSMREAMRGPSAVLKGSREALEAVRSQRLASLGINKKNDVAELQKEGNKHLKNMDKNIASMKQESNKSNIVVGAFGNS